jgi:hypothetical protein
MRTVPIKPETYNKLRALAHVTGDSLPDLVDKAIEAYRRQQFLAKCNAAYEAIKSDPRAWSAELNDREAWDCTLLDGLDGNES